VYIDMHSGLNISQADPRPMYLQIKEQIRHRVALGDWPPGKEVPSIRQLAIELRVSVITVKRAYLELEREGVIVTQHGKGSFVAEGANIALDVQEQELEEHLANAVRIGKLLGLTDDDIAARLRAIQKSMADKTVKKKA
jgi:GntR family transcriptional regulator